MAFLRDLSADACVGCAISFSGVNALAFLSRFGVGGCDGCSGGNRGERRARDVCLDPPEVLRCPSSDSIEPADELEDNTNIKNVTTQAPVCNTADDGLKAPSRSSASTDAQSSSSASDSELDEECLSDDPGDASDASGASDRSVASARSAGSAGSDSDSGQPNVAPATVRRSMNSTFKGDAADAGCSRGSTILIFDWDDTLLPSTWIRDQGFGLDRDSEPTTEQQALLDAISESVARTLRIAHRYGEVVLITNAESRWIEMSCRKFMPSLVPLLARTRMVSARSTYEQGTSSPFEWKFLAFEREVRRFYENAPAGLQKNVVSFGDSSHEREALHRVTQHLANCHTKCLKFVERPDPEQLLKEHELMGGCIPRVARHDGDLDLCVDCS